MAGQVVPVVRAGQSVFSVYRPLVAITGTPGHPPSVDAGHVQAGLGEARGAGADAAGAGGSRPGRHNKSCTAN